MGSARLGPSVIACPAIFARCIVECVIGFVRISIVHHLNFAMPQTSHGWS